MLWHVDDLKTNHIEKEVLEKFIEFLRTIYDDNEIGKIIVNKGPVYEFVGMKLDYSVPGKLIVDMVNYVEKIVENFEELDYVLPKKTATPAAIHLFKMNDDVRKLNKEIKKIFHTYTAKSLFLCKRERPDIQTTVAFLITRVVEPDENN